MRMYEKISMNKTREIEYIKQIKDLKEQLKLDSKTKLFNREYFDSLNLSGGLYLFCDGDGLKDINLRFGHNAGNEAIIMISRAIKESARHTDIATRFGGDEFIIFIEDISIIQAIKLSKRIIMNVNKYSFGNIRLGLSIGIGKNIKLADKMLYKAKLMGKNKVVYK